MKVRFMLGVAAYLLPTFLIAYPWHLVIFGDNYRDLAIYREEVIVPFGFLAILFQGSLFAWIFPKIFKGTNWLENGLCYGMWLAVLSWTFTTLAAAAKHPMNSIGEFMLLETGFVLIQCAVVGPLTAYVFRN